MRDAWAESDALISLMGEAECFGVLRALMILRADFRTLRLQQSLVKQVTCSSAWPWERCILSVHGRTSEPLAEGSANWQNTWQNAFHLVT